jgi:hypothetical protein
MPNRFSHGTSLGFPGRDTMLWGISLNHGLFRQENISQRSRARQSESAKIG